MVRHPETSNMDSLIILLRMTEETGGGITVVTAYQEGNHSLFRYPIDPKTG